MKIRILLLFTFMIFSSSAQKGANSEAKIKAVFLYNFTRFVEWPARSFSSETAPFVIGIIGEDPFGAYIEQAIVGEKVNSHPIVIRRFNSIAEIEDCHILFVNLHDGGMIKQVVAHVSGKNILTVSDANNFAGWGGIIRFYSEESKVKIEINTTAAKAAQLSISSKLLSVSQIY
ncbi:MAG: YfiR family protein [Bacteroidetes bacterium]|nr:YfiR family protein [Bacteroidota bacterium]MBK8363980.1 YfiR family protein [Bacteroidota bacterium]